MKCVKTGFNIDDGVVHVSQSKVEVDTPETLPETAGNLGEIGLGDGYSQIDMAPFLVVAIVAVLVAVSVIIVIVASKWKRWKRTCGSQTNEGTPNDNQLLIDPHRTENRHQLGQCHYIIYIHRIASNYYIEITFHILAMK